MGPNAVSGANTTASKPASRIDGAKESKESKEPSSKPPPAVRERKDTFTNVGATSSRNGTAPAMPEADEAHVGEVMSEIYASSTARPESTTNAATATTSNRPPETVPITERVDRYQMVGSMWVHPVNAHEMTITVASNNVLNIHPGDVQITGGDNGGHYSNGTERKGSPTNIRVYDADDQQIGTAVLSPRGSKSRLLPDHAWFDFQMDATYAEGRTPTKGKHVYAVFDVTVNGQPITLRTPRYQM